MIFDELYNKINQFLVEYFADSKTDFLIDLEIKKGNKIIVHFDSEVGVTVDKCARLNRVLYKFIEESDFFPDGNFSLEVSSPGVDEPLKFERQYRKNIDREIEVITNENSILQGKLLSVSDQGIIIEEKKGKGKKAIIINHEISFEKIKSTRVLLKI